MLDQLKVNQNSIINLLKTPERENNDAPVKSSGKDFFSMILEQSRAGDFKINNDTMDRKISDPAKEYSKKNINESREADGKPVESSNAVSENKNREIKADNDRNSADKSESNNGNKELKTDNKVENKNSSQSSAEDAKIDNKMKQDEVEAAADGKQENEIILKDILDIVKAVLSGSRKAEEEGYQKLFSNLKLKNLKENGAGFFSGSRGEEIKNSKSAAGSLAFLFKELKESIGKEIQKLAEHRKTGSKNIKLSDKELRELAVTIIENVKKGKNKEIVKHEVRINNSEENRQDRKFNIQIEEPAGKKHIITDESLSDKNGSKDRNTGKDNFSFNSSKFDQSLKSGIDKIESNQKMTDFRENLQEIIDKAKVTVRDSRNGAFTVRLNPQELGNVNVNIVMENGVITGRFLVDNDDVKGMLQAGLNELKSQMEDAGLTVGDFSVNVSDQRERYFKEDKEEKVRSLSVFTDEKEVLAAVENYNSNAGKHSGHINMVI